ncbi:efflux RND transporter periplasmic adaptor subunit [Acinetobacter sp. UBA801]|jgi:multidrug efflux system membrane fusion protein|uniref:efflux RND transporter periplasmic adaptor subunit n=1 Tax=Acinetobacter sp. UBA801 TaxID=1945958 RepID=UPI001B69BEBB|nr:efflux RND transporter periplasmic adaptor subunit [Acinetobacter sp. UBA801]MBP8012846.1 efflux RND transporter periplasmic adaptor subunit [Acinetobacter sp.]
MNTTQNLIGSLMLLCCITLMGCSKQKTEVEQEVPLVMVTQPSSLHLEQKSYAGEVQARQQTALAFRVAGQVTQRFADVGDRVKVGQVLATLDVQDAALQLNAARAQLESAQSAAKIASDELQRFQQLLPMNAVSRSQYDAVKNQYQHAMAQLKQAQSNYAVSSNQTDYNQLRATKNGVITERNIEVGQVLAAGQVAYQLAIDGEREVVIGVPEQAVAEIRVGQEATVSLWSQPDSRFTGTVREISPAADQSRTFKVKVALREGNAQIQLGQSARVFLTRQANQGLYVPLSSVSATGQQAFVLVLQADSTVRQTPVTLGAYGRDSVPVLSGLQAQDYVVMGGVHLLRDRQKIRPINRDNQAVQAVNPTAQAAPAATQTER